jgi:hypothetical protein
MQSSDFAHIYILVGWWGNPNLLNFLLEPHTPDGGGGVFFPASGAPAGAGERRRHRHKRPCGHPPLPLSLLAPPSLAPTYLASCSENREPPMADRRSLMAPSPALSPTRASTPRVGAPLSNGSVAVPLYPLDGTVGTGVRVWVLPLTQTHLGLGCFLSFSMLLDFFPWLQRI